MEKLDLKKMYAHLYKVSAKKPALVEVPAMNFLMVDGQGDPNTSPDFQPAVEALYGLSYTLKFGFKTRKVIDWTVMALEGLWWSSDREKLAAFARENGYALAGKHHEIYLNDPRRTAPEKLKTILRHPVRKA
jgi:hypothetical protein